MLQHQRNLSVSEQREDKIAISTGDGGQTDENATSGSKLRHFKEIHRKTKIAYEGEADTGLVVR